LYGLLKASSWLPITSQSSCSAGDLTSFSGPSTSHETSGPARLRRQGKLAPESPVDAGLPDLWAAANREMRARKGGWQKVS